MHMKKNKKGFTLVELVIVIAILAVLATVAIPAITPLTTDAKANVDAVNAKTIESVVKLAIVEASKDSPVSVTLDTQQVFNAVYEAEMNIESGSFACTVASGTVVPTTAAAATADTYLIVFSNEEGADALTVLSTTGGPITSYVEDYVPADS